MTNRTATVLVLLCFGGAAAIYFGNWGRNEPQQPGGEAGGMPISISTEEVRRSRTRLAAIAPVDLAQTESAEPSAPVVRTNRLAALLNGQETPLPLTREQIDAWLALNKTNAESLMAAAQLGEDRSLLLTALTNFPNDPRVLFTVAALDRSPVMRRELLDRFKEAAPDNSLADYLSARDHFEDGMPELAIQDLLEASQKTSFDDYVLEQIQSREDLLLESGKSPAEAKAVASSGALLPHLAQLKKVAQEMAGLQRQYIANGDHASAEQLAQMGVQLGAQLSSGDGSRCLINQLVGYAIERIVLSPLDQQRVYDFAQGTIPQRFEFLQERRAAAKQSVHLFNEWWVTATEPEIISYFDRQKLYGESSALAWLQSRYGAP